jgi:hypothetical protein
LAKSFLSFWISLAVITGCLDSSWSEYGLLKRGRAAIEIAFGELIAALSFPTPPHTHHQLKTFLNFAPIVLFYPTASPEKLIRSAPFSRIYGSLASSKGRKFSHTFEVPFLHNEQFAYDNSRFSDFAKKLDETEGKAEKLSSFIQSWLFFGLIKEIFEYISGIEVDLTDFIKDSKKGYRVLTTENLRTPICLWHAREAGGPNKERLERWYRVQKCLTAADTLIMNCLKLPNDLDPECDLKIVDPKNSRRWLRFFFRLKFSA